MFEAELKGVGGLARHDPLLVVLREVRVGTGAGSVRAGQRHGLDEDQVTKQAIG